MAPITEPLVKSDTSRAQIALRAFKAILEEPGRDCLNVDVLGPALEALARSLEGASTFAHELATRDASKMLGDRGVPRPDRLVTAALGPERRAALSDRQGKVLALADPEPWAEPVDGAALLSELVAALGRHVVLPRGAATSAALWIIHAHALDAFDVSPLLAVVSPAKRCGKTTLLEVLESFVPRPLSSANISAAALFRTVERFSPTLVIDEADTFLDGKDELRGLLNAGHTRTSAFVVRTVGEDFEPRRFSTWCPKVIARIGEPAETLADRAIIIRLRRRTREEHVDRLRRGRPGSVTETLRRQAWRWAHDNLADLTAADPTIPECLHDRAADNWRPLLAVADLAGGEWPARARRSATLLSGAEASEGPAVELLAACRAVFDRVDRLATADLLTALSAREWEPWPTWNHGNPISARQVARLLARFGIGPAQLWTQGGKVRGYARHAFVDAWARYLPSHPVDAVENARSSEDRELSHPVGIGGLPDGSDEDGLARVKYLPLGPDTAPPIGRAAEDGFDADWQAVVREGA